MPVTSPQAGFVSALLAKLAGASTTAKAVVAGVTAAATFSIAGAAAGVLPGPAQGAVTGVVNAVSPLSLPADDPAAGIDAAIARVNQLPSSIPSSVPVDAGASASTPAASASAKTAAKAQKPAPSSVALPPVTPPPAVGSLPANPSVALPSCVTNLVPVGTTPDPTRLLSQIPGCIQSVLGTANLPVNVSSCVAAVLATVSAVLSPGSVGNLPQLKVSACVPFDISKCTSNTMSAMGSASAGASMPFVGDMVAKMFAAFGGLSSLSNVPGCVPFDIGRCITSVVGSLPGLASGGVPNLDLSACLPVGITSGLPGLPAGTPSIPGIGGSIP